MVPILLKMKYQGYLEQLFSKCSCCGFSGPLKNNYICFSQQRWWQFSAGGNWQKEVKPVLVKLHLKQVAAPMHPVLHSIALTGLACAQP